ncbi:MAG: hypothetical protein JNJ90_09685 [Saprospiraceae bacterium]|nr:hypothetical protein [Saprospiraceae bacterium]
MIAEAAAFCAQPRLIPELFGVTDGKAVGTIIEHNFKQHLTDSYTLEIGNTANGIDLPGLGIETDIKVTSIRQPQSSSPFKEAKQKIFGLGYNLLVFVYDKKDDPTAKTAVLDFVSCTFIEKERTGDYTTTLRLREMVNDGANEEDIVAYLSDRNLPANELALLELARQILNNPPAQGYLTISNALQWRLQYQRIVNLREAVPGITKIASEINK